MLNEKLIKRSIDNFYTKFKWAHQSKPVINFIGHKVEIRNIFWNYSVWIKEKVDIPSQYYFEARKFGRVVYWEWCVEEDFEYTLNRILHGIYLAETNMVAKYVFDELDK